MDFLKYDDDASGPDLISCALLCVVEHMCTHLGIQIHTESGEHGCGCFGPFLTGRNWSLLVCVF